MDVVLYNAYGCEIARERVERRDEIAEVISGWVVDVGDTIKFEEAYDE